MTIEEYNNLDEETKKIFLFEADKVAEREEGLTKIQLFKIDDFYIETRRSVTDPARRFISTFPCYQ